MSQTKSRNDLSTDEYQPYYQPYIGLVTEPDILAAIADQPNELDEVLGGLSEEESGICHQPYTWTIKQVIGHCIDNERVFGYRAARFAASDQTPLAGYEQNEFVANTNYDICKLDDLVEEFKVLRQSNYLFLKRIAPECWDLSGPADGRHITVRAIAFLSVGHLRHHLNIVRQRLSK